MIGSLHEKEESETSYGAEAVAKIFESVRR